MPTRINAPPPITASVGVSFKKINANTAEPTGSDNVVTATMVADKYLSSQLKVECPINCGIAAKRKIQPYALGGYPKGLCLDTNIKIFRATADTPYTKKI